MNSQLAELNREKTIEVLNLIANKTGEIIRHYFRNLQSIEYKADQSIVTVADQKAEEVAREIINSAFPDHNILGEEFGETNKASPFKWVIDPIDGTTSFAAGSFDFGTVVGLLFNDQPIYGMINQPIIGDLLIGDNETTTLNGIPLNRGKTKKRLSEAILSIPDVFSVERFQSWDSFYALSKKVKCVRTWGNAYGYALLAMGNIDIMLDPIVSTWDIAGVIPIVRGAGCVITDYKGNPFSSSQRDVIAAKSHLHPIVLKDLSVKANATSRMTSLSEESLRFSKSPELSELMQKAAYDGVSRCVVGAISVDANGKVFLMQRSPDEFMANCWEFPGGGVDEGESLIEALVREVREEAGLVVTEIIDYVDSFDYEGDGGKLNRQFNFTVMVTGMPVLSKEHSSYRWVAIDEALNMTELSDIFKSSLEKIG
ncbi:MAG: NUDIX domain-containing protein [Symploca sp. SIO3C6]|nr:NUDIX domain-containing protein [Symploca sp. SIO3C6]